MTNGLERPGCDERARVLVADDHQSLLDRVVSILHDEYEIVGTVTDGTALVKAEADLSPDVVVCLTAHQEPEIVEAALRSGVLGYVTKTSLAQDLLPAVRSVLGGRRFV